MNRPEIAGLIASILAGIGGCAQPTYAPPPTPIAEPAAYPQIVVSPDLARWIAVDRPIVTGQGDHDGPLQVSVPVRTLTRGESIRVQYRFVFLDERGRPVHPEGDWRYERMASRVQKFFEAGALDERAVDWRLEIRTAR
ncbi:MAG: DUF1425 domain-containing protein [Planctomycetota bacterium]|nr:MAG: DUF1425 domain-containing protein [Planctomycetota bacterium]